MMREDLHGAQVKQMRTAYTILAVDIRTHTDGRTWPRHKLLFFELGKERLKRISLTQHLSCVSYTVSCVSDLPDDLPL